MAALGTFWGYRREDGSAGVRNHLVVIPSVICANTVAQRVAALLPGAVAIPHPHGCAQVGDDVTQTEKVLAGAAANPNVGAALIIGLGCETCQASQVADLAQAMAPGRPMESFYIQETGGSIKAIAHGVETGKRLMERIGAQQRERIPLSELVIATECGGVDLSSMLAANPTVGHVSDRVVGAGGTVLLTETPELVGAGDVLVRRARDPGVAQALRDVLQSAEQEAARLDRRTPPEDVAASDPTPGGTTTGIEASLSCLEKAGSSRVEGVLAFAGRPSGRGLYVMDAPAQETVAVSAMAAAGAQVCLFTTGRGSPLGNAISPVIKVCGNPETLERMGDNMDFSTAAVMEGSARPRDLAPQLAQLLLDVCSGQLTNAEIIGHQEFGIHRIGPTV
ncbi:MAG: UxaA family hydrolase [Chloroflexota bacterium]|nr:UxaA family hydrolase [Chloroflexota bacterium]